MFKDSHAFSGYSYTDTESTKQFYGETLGLDVTDNGMGLELSFPNGHSVFLYQKDNHQPATFTVLNFVVPNINDAVDELLAKGVVMERYPDMPGAQDERGIMRGKAANMGPDIAWFKDPSGNILGVIEE